MRSPRFLLPILGSCLAVDLGTIAEALKSISASIYPGLRVVSENIYNHPETSTQEFYAHDTIVNYFTTTQPGLWDVTPHAYGQPTAFVLDFAYTPDTEYKSHVLNDNELLVIGFLAEYDALLGIGHACGHHLIALNGLLAAGVARQALVDLGIAGRVRVVGCPDEENGAGKARLRDAGAFDGIDVWLMAHPTVTSAVQPMQARVNAAATFAASTHSTAIRAAYETLVLVTDLEGMLPGTSSTAEPIEDVGMFSINVVAREIRFGVSGLHLRDVNTTVSRLLADGTYPGVNYTIAEVVDGDVHDGIALTIHGPGGHASEGTKSPLRLSIETFRALQGQEGVDFFLPGNTTATELDITTSVRTRYTLDVPAVLDVVLPVLAAKASAPVTTDLPYSALEVEGSILTERFISLMGDVDHESQNDWVVSDTAPAATDAGIVQDAEVDPETRQLRSVGKVVFHPNYRVCERAANGSTIGPCGFNHEPVFAEAAATEYAYAETETVARALAQLAVEMIADEDFMNDVTAFVRK